MTPDLLPDYKIMVKIYSPIFFIRLANYHVKKNLVLYPSNLPLHKSYISNFQLIHAILQPDVRKETLAQFFNANPDFKKQLFTHILPKFIDHSKGNSLFL